MTKREAMRLPVEDLIKLTLAANDAMDYIYYAKGKGGKYRTVDTMFRKLTDYKALREEIMEKVKPNA